MTSPALRLTQFALAVIVGTVSVNVFAQKARPIDPDKARVVEYWTKERRAAAIPRDLVIDERGLGYLRRPDGTLQPYGHEIAAQEAPRAATPNPFAKPGGGGKPDTRPPSISSMNPASGATIGTTHTFSAVVKDSGGVASVDFSIWQGSTFGGWTPATSSGTDTYTLAQSGMAVGDWNWQVLARDVAGNERPSSIVAFKVSDGSSGGGTPVTDATWPYPNSSIQKAAGRLYFEMPANSRQTKWWGYVCSGTVATDGVSLRSIIVTAAHCVYDDSNKAFARNVFFIPNQAASGTATDLNCSNDVMGCWVPSFGVVHENWTNVVWPNNIEWDYAYYVVPDTGAHTQGTSTTIPDALDTAAGSFAISFAAPVDSTAFEYALGYSYDKDPLFRYCSENMTTDPNSSVDWWLGSCLLSGGSSGGPWIQPTSTTTPWAGETTGRIISINSYGYTGSAGMAGPKLNTDNAKRVYCAAKLASMTAPSNVIVPSDAITTCP